MPFIHFQIYQRMPLFFPLSIVHFFLTNTSYSYWYVSDKLNPKKVFTWGSNNNNYRVLITIMNPSLFHHISRAIFFICFLFCLLILNKTKAARTYQYNNIHAQTQQLTLPTAHTIPTSTFSSLFSPPNHCY